MKRGGNIRRWPKSAAERAEIEAVRRQVFERAQGDCELRISPKCWGNAGWSAGHLAHNRHGIHRGPWHPDGMKWSCAPCHAFQHTMGADGQKPVPAKDGGLDSES